MAKSKVKSAYTQFKEKADYFYEYSRITQEVKDNKVIPGIHNIAAGILKKKGLEDLANNLMDTSQSPDNHALLGIMQTGVDIFRKEYDDFGKNKLVAIVNSKDLKIDRVRDALLFVPPEKKIKGYELVSEAHIDASKFYMDLYAYQDPKKQFNLNDEQKAGLKHNMKVRVMEEYKDKFKDDKEFFNRLGSLIQGYEGVAIAQYKTFTDAKVKKFSDKLKSSNAGKYVEAMNFSDQKRSVFYKTLLE